MTDEDLFAFLRNSGALDDIRKALDAKEAHRTANDPLSRHEHHRAIGAAIAEFVVNLGVGDALHRGVVENALDEPGLDKKYKDQTFEALTRPEMMKTAGGQAVLGAIIAQVAMTLLTIFGAKLTGTMVQHLRLSLRGRDGPFATIPKSGVARGSGALFSLREETMVRLGYTAGCENSRLKGSLLKRAADYYNKRSVIYGGEKVKPSDIREWAQRSYSEVFGKAYQEGSADRVAGTIDLTRQL